MDLIYYDVTRLLCRHSAPTPTGIDRVDIRYAHYFLNKKQKTVFVYQKKGVFFQLSKSPAKKLIESLYSAWIKSERASEKDLSNIYKKSTGKSSLQKTKSRLQQITGKNPKEFKFVDGALVDTLFANRNLKGSYINTSHHGVGNIDAYYVFKTVGQVAIVFYLHDIIPIDYPEYVREGDDKTHATRVTAMAYYADRVLVNSTYTKDRFYHFCDKNKIRKPDVTIAYIGIEESFIANMGSLEKKDSSDIKISGKYFVAVSTIEPRKNHILLLNIWRSLLQQEEKEIPKLILIGKRGWNIQSFEDFMDRSPSIKEHVIELSGLSDLQLMTLMKNSKGILFPSFVEGWGMPIVEALALKIPVVCSDIPAFRESGQNLAQYLNPIDAISWKNEILKISRSNTYFQKLAENSGSAELPTWENHFLLLERSLESIPFKTRHKQRQKPTNIKKSFKHSLEEKKPYTSHDSFRKHQERTAFQRKMQKLKKDPQAFLDDSNFFFFKLLGDFLRKY